MNEETKPDAVPEIEAIVHRIYAIVCGPRTRLRDWDQVRAIFWPTARVISIYNFDDGKCRVRDLTVEEWITAASARFAAGDFYERGVILDTFATAHLFSVSSPFESRHEINGSVFERGINHYSFFNDGDRWWLSNLVWEVEGRNCPLPHKASAALRELPCT